MTCSAFHYAHAMCATCSTLPHSPCKFAPECGHLLSHALPCAVQSHPRLPSCTYTAPRCVIPDTLFLLETNLRDPCSVTPATNGPQRTQLSSYFAEIQCTVKEAHVSTTLVPGLRIRIKKFVMSVPFFSCFSSGAVETVPVIVTTF